MSEVYAETSPEDQREINEVAKWFTELKISEKDKHYVRFKEQAKKAVRRFSDEQRTEDGKETGVGAKRFNVLRSNIQTLGPAVYSRVPKPQVDRRKRNRDSVAKNAAEMLERTLDYSVQSYDFDHVLVNCRQDALLPGLGQVWVRSASEFGPEQIDPTSGKPFTPVISEKVVADYVHWSDFRANPARTWDEVRWVARRVYLSKQELVKAFGKDVAEACKCDHVPDNISEDKELKKEQDEFKKAIVFEIWDKPTRKVMHISRGYDKFLKIVDDPLHLEGFFPCPRPLTGVTANESIWPYSDFSQYQDQAEELDELTQRESLLVEALRVVGIYDASKEELGRLLEEAAENQMIPVADWSSYSSSGGLQGAVDFLPLESIIQTLLSIREAKRDVLQEIYELTGISDIVRGNSAPSETATAQQIKGQFATLRLSDRQKAFQRFSRDIIAIKGELISEHFHPQTFAEILGADLQDPDTAQSFMPAVELLKNEKLRSFRIDIETDSTISVNEELEKQAAGEFLTSIGPFFQQAAQTIAVDPIWGGVIGEMLMFYVRKFKAGRALEGSLQSAVDQAIQKAQEAAAAPPQEPPPDPRIIEAQTKMQLERDKFEFDKQLQSEKQFRETEKSNFEAQLKKMQQDLEAQAARFELALEREKLNGNLNLQAFKIESDMRLKAYERPESSNLDTIESLKKPEAPAPQPMIVNIENVIPDRPRIKEIARSASGGMVPVYEPNEGASL
jgi:hypothetical protein